FGSGPFNIYEGDTLKVAFALIAGDNLFDLQNNAIAAQSRYDSIYANSIEEITTNENLFEVYPSLTSGLLFSEIKLTYNTQVNIELYSLNGHKVHSFINKNLTKGSYFYTFNLNRFPSGVYYICFTSEKDRIIKKISVM
ncbi:MAG: T9SS type A sorting domain-containing protein, partial [Bacteroidia bacterium]|nr:T9SS type A sorting domain-containing protein [Bacteroidia bacterium]